MARKTIPVAFTAPEYVLEWLKKESRKQSYKKDKDIRVSHLILKAVVEYYSIEEVEE